MNPSRYFMPNMVINPMMQNSYGLSSLSRMIQGIKSFNWGKLLSGANKTLNVVNQTILLMKQATPMIGNVKKMVKLARAFGNETNYQKNTVTSNKYQNSINNDRHSKPDNNDYPTFFV